MAIVKLLKIEFSRKFRPSALSALSLPERTKHNTTIKKSLSAQCVCVFFFYCKYRSDFSLSMMSSSSKSSSTGERVAPIRSHVRFFMFWSCAQANTDRRNWFPFNLELEFCVSNLNTKLEFAQQTQANTHRDRQTLNDARWGASPRLTT